MLQYDQEKNSMRKAAIRLFVGLVLLVGGFIAIKGAIPNSMRDNIGFGMILGGVVVGCVGLRDLP